MEVFVSISVASFNDASALITEYLAASTSAFATEYDASACSNSDFEKVVDKILKIEYLKAWTDTRRLPAHQVSDS